MEVIKMGLIKEPLNDAINSLVGDMFCMNRLMDRQMSILGVKFAMNKTSDVLHKKMAHAYPMLADVLSDYQSSRNNLTIYPETPVGNETYARPLDIFNSMLKKQLEIEDNISEAIVLAYDEGDMVTKSFLQSFIVDFNKYTSQILLLIDKATMYGDIPKHWMDFDSHVEDFVTL